MTCEPSFFVCTARYGFGCDGVSASGGCAGTLIRFARLAAGAAVSPVFGADEDEGVERVAGAEFGGRCAGERFFSGGAGLLVRGVSFAISRCAASRCAAPSASDFSAAARPRRPICKSMISA